MNRGAKLAPQLRQSKLTGRYLIWVPAAFGRKAWFKSLRTKDRAEAEALFNNSTIHDLVHTQGREAVEQAFWARLIIGNKVTVRQAVDNYTANMLLLGRKMVSCKDASEGLERWIKFCRIGISPISSIRTGHVSAFINRKGDQMYSTRVKDLKMLRSFFTYCVSQDCIPKNPCLGVEVRRENLTQAQLAHEKKEPFTDDEMDRILAAVPPVSEWRGMILFMRYFGLRRSDTATLEWGMIKDGRLKMATRKTNSRIDEPLPQPIIDWMQNWPHNTATIDAMKASKLKSIRERASRLDPGQDYVFPRAAMIVNDGYATTLSSEFSEILKRIGIEGKTMHCFRVTTVTREMDAMLDKLGGPEKAILSGLLATHGIRGVQKLIGHAAGSMITAGTYFNPKASATQPALAN